MAVAVVVVVVVAVPVAVTVALVVALQHAGRRQHSGLRLGLLDLRCSDSWSASLPGGMPGELCSRGLSSVLALNLLSGFKSSKSPRVEPSKRL